MYKSLTLITLLFFFGVCPDTNAQETQASNAETNDEKVIAVMEILELMEVVEDIALFKDMEYLTEGDPNEPQD